jgi:hypothetical protein
MFDDTQNVCHQKPLLFQDELGMIVYTFWYSDYCYIRHEESSGISVYVVQESKKRNDREDDHIPELLSRNVVLLKRIRRIMPFTQTQIKTKAISSFFFDNRMDTFYNTSFQIAPSGHLSVCMVHTLSGI